MTTDVVENEFLLELVRGLPRSQLQINGHQESDAELIRLPGHTGVLALNIDNLVEEIDTGLYDDPYLIGWMTVLASVSDLAAVGAEPIGILLSETLPANAGENFINRLRRGIQEACAASGFAVLGGDTNFSAHAQFGAFALGWIEDGNVITRRGCSPGDLLYASGRLGWGSAYAFLKLQGNESELGAAHKPIPRLREGRLIRRFGTCAMDTSDGALATLDQLMRINRMGFQLDTPAELILHPLAKRLSKTIPVASWMMLAGPHGEFELIFTLPPSQEEAFLMEAVSMGWDPLRIGRVVPCPEVSILVDGDAKAIDTGRIRNLFGEVCGNVDRFIEELGRIHASISSKGKGEQRKEAISHE